MILISTIATMYTDATNRTKKKKKCVSREADVATTFTLVNNDLESGITPVLAATPLRVYVQKCSQRTPKIYKHAVHLHRV